MATIRKQPISIHGGFKPGEKVIERLDISVRLPRSRNVQRRIYVLLLLFFFWIIFAAAQFPAQAYFLLPILAGWIILWFIFNGSIELLFPQYSELVVTNQRLLLRAGPRFVAWVSNYDREIEVFVMEEFAAFAVRPNIDSCSPHEVFVKSVSPFHQGKHLAALLRSLSEGQLLAGSGHANSITSGAKISPSLSLSLKPHLPSSLPPGIAVTHAFLSQQLRSLIASIPVAPVIPEMAVLSAINSLSASADASQNTDLRPNTHTANQLGDTGYQFGVDK